MLTRFRVNNFRSLVNFEFRPTGLNLLIGKNNSGKTNLCYALRFLGASTLMTLDEAAKFLLGESWNITNVYIQDQDLEFDVEAMLKDGSTELNFTYSLRLIARRDSTSLKQSLEVKEEILSLDGGGFKRTKLLENRAGGVRLLHEKWYLGGKSGEHYVETHSPPDATMLRRLFDLETNRRANLFKRYLQKWSYYNFAPQSLRSPEVVSEQPALQHDGKNLSKLLFTLHNQKPRDEKKVIDAARELDPKLDCFAFQAPEPNSVFMFMDDAEGKRFSIQSMSDGTLRFLAIASVLLLALEEGKSNGAPPLVIIEEPENGLYVGHLKPLLDRIDKSGSGAQIIFTSHNPYFIDLFDGNVEGLHLLKPGKPSSVLTRPDPTRVGELLKQMSLGELHFREMLV